MTIPTPRATYRLQLGPRTDFAAAAERLAHLQALGVSHLYTSPVTEAEPDSSHGYDVTDHAAVRRQLGGTHGLADLADAARGAGLGLVIDHVPNHASIASPRHNHRWWETLRYGPGHESARFFDVDWRAWNGKVLLPILSGALPDELAAGRLTVGSADGEPILHYGEVILPLAPDTADLPLPDLLEAQHYRLVRWRRRDRNMRRFFVIDSLAAVRAEDELVADEINTVPRRLWRAGAVDGIRVDHVDGLADPGRYLEQLRHDASDAWIVVEKILAPDERLPSSWPVQGTTGYDFLRVVDHLLLDPDGETPLTALWHELTGDPRPFDDHARQARHEVLNGSLAPDLDRVSRRALQAWPRDAGPDPARITAALAALTVETDRYRTYLGDDPEATTVVDRLAGRAAERHPDLAPELAAMAELLITPSSPAAMDVAVRWQQLTAPVVAKGDEDCAFYRYHRLIALCEVGGEPGRFGITPEVFHHDCTWRAEHAPRSMLAGTTHDTKRSEDVRARLLVLAEIPDRWRTFVDRAMDELEPGAGDVPAGERYLALQTAVGAWPLAAERLEAFLVKAGREAAVHTRWSDPDEGYETALGRLAAQLTGEGAVASAVASFAADIAPAGWSNSLAQLVLRLTVPGVPDIYQGTESWSLRLVDPDNRMDPDWSALEAQVRRAGSADIAAAWASPGDGLVKTAVLTRTLALRARRTSSFDPGATYTPLTATGDGAEHIVAHRRGDDVVVAVVRRPVGRAARPAAASLQLPTGTWHNVLVPGVTLPGGDQTADAVLAGLPVAVYERA